MKRICGEQFDDYYYDKRSKGDGKYADFAIYAASQTDDLS
jgi:hypothetical protein